MVSKKTSIDIVKNGLSSRRRGAAGGRGSGRAAGSRIDRASGVTRPIPGVQDVDAIPGAAAAQRRAMPRCVRDEAPSTDA